MCFNSESSIGAFTIGSILFYLITMEKILFLCIFFLFTKHCDYAVTR